MTQEATLKSRIEKVSKELEVENDTWAKLKIAPGGYRMNDAELYVRCEVIAIYKIMKDKLGISEDEFTLYLRTAVLEQMRELRKTHEAARSQRVREELTRGIHIHPPKNLKNGEL